MKSLNCLSEQAQVSIELIVVLAALVIVALLLVSRIYDTGKTASRKFASTSDKIFDKLDKLGKEA